MLIQQEKGNFKEKSQAERGWSVERSDLSPPGTVLSCGRVTEGQAWRGACAEFCIKGLVFFTFVPEY